MIAPHRSDPACALTRALTAMLAPATAKINALVSTPWASATFTGARHEIAISVDGHDAPSVSRRFVDQIATADFSISGHLVADIAITHYRIDGEGAHLCIEALTVESA